MDRRDLQVLRERAKAIFLCLDSPPERRPREHAESWLKRYWVWRHELSWHNTYFQRSLDPLKSSILRFAILKPTLLQRLDRWATDACCTMCTFAGDPRAEAKILAESIGDAKQRYMTAFPLIDMEAEIQELYLAPKWTIEGDGGKQARNALLKRWHVSEGMKAAAIRDRWNGLSDEERQLRFPNAWKKFESESGKRTPADYANDIAHILNPPKRNASAKKAVN